MFLVGQGKYLVIYSYFNSQMSIEEYLVFAFNLIRGRKIRCVNFMLKVKNESRLSHYTNEVILALHHG